MGNKIAEFGKLAKCVLLSFVVTVILCGIFAAAVTLWNIEEKTAQLVIFAFTVISVLFGAFVLAKNVGHSGLVNGLVMALFYFTVLSLLSFFINGKAAFDAKALARLVTISASGMLGGILGINT